MDLKKNVLFALGLIIPALVIFRTFFTNSPLVWGDAPYFYSEALKELVREPYAWTSWGNNFGGVNSVLWLYPLMFLYGALHTLLGFSNDVILRIIFYFPSVVAAFVSPIILARYLGYSRIVQFFASLFYGLNTYFLLLIDGGQVGIALAYGLFPIALYGLKRLLDKPAVIKFFTAVGLIFLLSLADVRFVAIAIFAVLLWRVIEDVINRDWKLLDRFFTLAFLTVVTVFLGSYWFLPLSISHANQMGASSNSPSISLLHTLFLFQPHWPENIFGKIPPPLFYFVGIPFLLFGALILKKEKKVLLFAFCFLLFAFLAKGSTEPLGGWYNWAINNLPATTAFRDTTKFFAPLIIFGGILIGITIEKITLLRNSVTFRKAIIITSYIYLLFLVHPAVLGDHLKGVLAGRNPGDDFKIISERIIKEQGDFRTLWFPERHPFSFHSNEKLALDAKRLVDERPFASLNVGTYDSFNFLHNQEFVDWFNLLGIKYLVFSGDARNLNPTEEEKKDWQSLINLISQTEGLTQEDLRTGIPVYSIPGGKPRIFAVDKLFMVLGSDDIYKDLRAMDSNFSVGNQGFLFLEDGKFNPSSLQEIASESALLVFNGRTEIDLAMSFLEEYFISTKDARFSQWALRGSDEYLRWKYELLINKVDVKEFDYGRGVAFSSQKGEKLELNLDIPENGEYVLAIRALSRSPEDQISLNFLGVGGPLLSSPGKFSWFIQDLKTQVPKLGKYTLIIKNESGFNVVNTVAIIPKKDWVDAQKFAREFAERFETINLGQDATKLQEIISSQKWHKVDYKQVSPVEYEFFQEPNGRWIIFTDRYDVEWMFDGKGSFPFYSTINGFYNDSSRQPSKIIFYGQKYVEDGLKISIFSFSVLIIAFFWYSRKGRQL